MGRLGTDTMREAVVTVSDADLASIGLGDLVSHCRAAGLRDVTALACDPTGAVLIVEVASALDADHLSSLDCIDRWERLAEADEGVRYLVSFTAPALSADVAERSEGLVGSCDPRIGDRGATLSLVGSQTDISDKVGAFEEAGMSVRLRELGPYEGDDRPLSELTDRQREVVTTAFELGYYEVPREATTAEVAGELDVDPSTVAEHLQRAERNLLARYLSSGP